MTISDNRSRNYSNNRSNFNNNYKRSRDNYRGSTPKHRRQINQVQTTEQTQSDHTDDKNKT